MSATVVNPAELAGRADSAALAAKVERLNALTGGDSLASNIALVLNNARLAANVAVAYASVRGEAGAFGHDGPGGEPK